MGTKKANADKANADKANADKANADKANADKANAPTNEALIVVQALIADHSLDALQSPVDAPPVVLPYAIWEAVEHYRHNPRTWRDEKTAKKRAADYRTSGWVPAHDQGVARLPIVGYWTDDKSAFHLALINGYGRCTPFRTGHTTADDYDRLQPTVRLIPMALENALRDKGLSLVDDYDQQQKYSVAEQWARYCAVADIASKEKGTRVETVRERGSLAIGKRGQNPNWYTLYKAFHADKAARRYCKPIITAWHAQEISMGEAVELAKIGSLQAREARFQEMMRPDDDATTTLAASKKAAQEALRGAENLKSDDYDTVALFTRIFPGATEPHKTALSTLLLSWGSATQEQRDTIVSALSAWPQDEADDDDDESDD